MSVAIKDNIRALCGDGSALYFDYQCQYPGCDYLRHMSKDE